MSQRIFQARKYVEYRLRASDEHGIHSPFVFDLYCNLFKDHSSYYCFEEIERLRTALSGFDKTIEYDDLGAGSVKANKTVAEIVKNAGSPAKYGQLLFKLVNRFAPETILELGTSFGFTTSYLAFPHRSAKVATIEGAEPIAKLARHNFSKLRLENIQSHIGNFDQLLPEVLKNLNTLDFVFIDGNHRREPTLRYFEQCLEKAHHNSVFVFDDIYWSKGMFEAWEKIKQHPKVTLSIDIYKLGIVFFRNEQRQKEHFILKF